MDTGMIWLQKAETITNFYSVVVISIGRVIAVKNVGRGLEEDFDCK